MNKNYALKQIMAQLDIWADACPDDETLLDFYRYLADELDGRISNLETNMGEPNGD